MVYEKCKVGKPYIRKQDGRQVVNIVYPDGKKSGMSYPRYLFEIRAGRYLKKNETIDHLDSDRLNNRPENLQVKDRSQHVTEDVKRVASQMFKCPLCGQEFVLSGQVLSQRSWKGRNHAGPFCGYSCSGGYGQKLRDGLIEPIPASEIKLEYYTLKSLFRENSCQI